MKPPIQYLNTDLEITSLNDPQPLVAALTLRGLWLLAAFQREDGSWFASFETHEQGDRPEPDILAMLSAIEALSGSASDFWTSCVSRDCHAGYEGGVEPKDVEHQISAKTLARMTASGVSLRVTLHPPEPGRAAS